MLYHEFLTYGSKPNLVVSKQYRQIPEAIPYINPIIYDGDPFDLEGAIKFAKSKCDDVKVTNLHGMGFNFQHRHPSYQYDQWERAGYLDKWDTLPLILPRQIKGSLQIPDVPFIIFGDHSQSSPFFHKEDLATALQENFPSWLMVRLSSVRASHPLDLLALMDKADLIISVDSMQLHMGKATTTPLIALVSDQPTRWQGSAYSKRFALHCRYGDFPRRKDEIVRVAKNCISGKPQLVATPMDTMKGGYNPSIIQFGDKPISVHRYHPKRAWPTRLAINDGQTSDILFPAELDGISLEDARLFIHQGKLMISYVLAKSRPVSNQFHCVIGYGMLVQREGKWHVEKHIQPKFRNNDWSGMVKNLCPFEHDGKIHFIWGNSLNEQVVIEVDGDKVTQEYRSPEPKWAYGEIRGGAIVRHGDKLLRLFHSRTGAVGYGAHGTFQYHVGASLMEATPPFKTVAVSKWPILSGDERYVPGCHSWKPNVVFVAGAVNESFRPLQISIGRNDSSSEIVKLQESDLNL